MSKKILLATLATLLIAAPMASAHTSYHTEDGAWTIVVGSQNEPIYTYQPTGLDLIIRDSEGNPATLADLDFTATLIAPNGEEMTMPLVEQHGAVGRFEFEEGYQYTISGTYHLRLDGTIGDTELNGVEIVVGRENGVGDNIYFPTSAAVSTNDLQTDLAGVKQLTWGFGAVALGSLVLAVYALTRRS